MAHDLLEPARLHVGSDHYLEEGIERSQDLLGVVSDLESNQIAEAMSTDLGSHALCFLAI